MGILRTEGGHPMERLAQWVAHELLPKEEAFHVLC